MKTKFIAYGILGMLAISSCKKQENVELTENSSDSKNGASVSYVADTSPKIVTYFPSYRDPATVSSTKYAEITHLYYAFLSCDAYGNLNPLPNPTRFNSVVASARANSVKMGISISGASNLASASSTTTRRTTLVNNLVNFVMNNNLDGLDVDWEFPRTDNGTSVTYTALMKELSTALHARNKYLSTALTAGVYAGAVRDAITTEVFGYTDFFNIMCYDGLGWDAAEPNQHSSYKMAEASLNYWATTRGMPKEKVILGLPAYGRSTATSASATFREMVAAGANTASDYFTYNGFSYGFNGTTTVTKKTNLAKTLGNGVMLWEIYGDITGSNSLLQTAKNILATSPPPPVVNTPGTYEIDINHTNQVTKPGWNGLLGTEGNTITINGNKFTLFGGIQGTRDRGSLGEVNRDFAFNEGASAGVGIRMEGLPAGTYNVTTWNYDLDYPGLVNVEFREAGLTATTEVKLTGRSLTNSAGSTFQIVVVAGKNYEIIVRENSIEDRSRFNGIALYLVP